MDKWEVRKVLMDVKKETIKKYFKFREDTFVLSVKRLEKIQVYNAYNAITDEAGLIMNPTNIKEKNTWAEDRFYFFNCKLFDINYIKNEDSHNCQLVLDFFLKQITHIRSNI